MATKTVKIQEVLQDTECYAANLAELAKKLDKEIEFEKNEETGEMNIKLDFKSGVDLLQIVWDQVKETAKECEGKDIKVKLPSGIAGLIAGAALQALGFKL